MSILAIVIIVGALLLLAILWPLAGPGTTYRPRPPHYRKPPPPPPPPGGRS